MDIKDVENLARLARINLSEEEKFSMLKDMQSILEYVKQVEEVKVPEAKPEPKLRNVWREDEIITEDISSNITRDKIIEQFPDSQDGYLKVKKIL